MSSSLPKLGESRGTAYSLAQTQTQTLNSLLLPTHLANVWLFDSITIPILAVEESCHVFLEGLESPGGRITDQLDAETAWSLDIGHVDFALFVVL